MSSISIDTNILIYSINTFDILKKNISDDLLSKKPLINCQNLSEFANVCKNKLKYSKYETIELVLNIINTCDYKYLKFTTYILAKSLIEKYDFQIFDAIIVASALENNCTILYSEDLQHNQIIENRLEIINPFV